MRNPGYIESYFRWEEETRHIHATIQTIVDIPVNESRAFLCLDRNVLEMAEESLSARCVPGTEVAPSSVFSENCYVNFTKTGPGIAGVYTVSFSFATLLSPEDSSVSADFDVEYAEDCWYPLDGGVLPAADAQGVFELLGLERRWEDFGAGTRLGVRGPMIPIDLLDTCPIRF